MSEKLKPNIDLKEILNPRNTPELGFQSYEMLGGDKKVRESQRDLFLAGGTENPTLDYPKLDEQKLNAGIANLERILSLADTLPEPQRSAVWDSAAYRMAEMYWLKSIININTAYQDGNLENIEELIKESQKLNEELYGSPSETEEKQILGEIFSQILSKDLSESNQLILKEIISGFEVIIGEDIVTVPGLELDTGDRLPAISVVALDRLKDKIELEFADILPVIDKYFEDIVSKRPESERVFTPADIYEVFVLAHQIRDPKNESGVQIRFNEDATALSWDTPTMSVIIGGRRAPISSITEMKAKVVHEYGVHGGRAVFGISTDLPVLGTGIYSESDPDEQADYLTFEEGLASTCEKAIHRKSEKWTSLDVERTLAVALANKGYDFRQVYETLFRLRILMTAKDGQDLSAEFLEKAKRNAYTTCERIFRGTPTSMPRTGKNGNPIVMSFNKDLAYLTGKLIAMDFIDTASEQDFDLSFKVKIDPTNQKQLELAKLVTSG